MALKPTPELTGYATLRRDLQHVAEETNALRLQLIEVQKKYSEIVTALIDKCDRIFTKALDEYDANGNLKKEFQPSDGSGGKMQETPEALQAVADHVSPGRRNCGLCKQPGHRAPNCPNAHEVKAAKEKAVKEPKKKRTVSPERAKQLAETLKKARAARAAKKGK